MSYYSLLAIFTVTCCLPAKAFRRYYVWPAPNTESMFAIICNYEDDITVNIFGGLNGSLIRIGNATLIFEYLCIADPVYFISRDAVYDVGLIETSTRGMISVIAHVTMGRYSEAYMALPSDHWNTTYLVAHTRLNGFISVLSETDMKLFVDVIQQKHTTSLRDVLKYIPYVVQNCVQFNNKPGKVTVPYNAILISNAYFGVISGYCPSQESTLLIQSDYPPNKLPFYQFVTFCVVNRNCSTQVVTFSSSPLTVISFITSECEIFYPDVPTTQTFYDKHMAIQSTVFVQVTIFVESAQASEDSPQYLAMIIVIPSALLLQEYVWAVPSNCVKHIAIIITSDNFDDLVFYIDFSNFYFVDLDSSEVLDQKKYQSWHIVNVDLPVAKTALPSVAHAYNSFYKTFGCYAYGVSEQGDFGSAISSNDVANSDTTIFLTQLKPKMLCQQHACIETYTYAGDYIDNDCDGYIDEERQNKEAHLSNISLTFEQAPDMQTTCYTGECPQRRDILVNNFTLVVICHVPDYVCQLNISYEMETFWCGVFVSPGRNVALGQRVSMSSQFIDSKGTRRRATLAVDGETHAKDVSCARTGSGYSNPSWHIVFKEPMILYEIVIYFEDYSYNEQFTIKYFDKQEKLIQENKDIVSPRVSLIPSLGSLKYAKSITVSLEGNTSILAICEFEAYGECAPPLYGPDCREICSITCDDQMCNYDGQCLQCPQGTGGTHCFDGCLSWCEENEDLFDEDVTTAASLTLLPYQVRTGFHVENFWYYVMVAAALVCIVCLSGFNYPITAKRLDNTLVEVKESLSLQGALDKSETAANRSYSMGSSMDFPPPYKTERTVRHSYSQSSSVDLPSYTSSVGD